MAIAYDVVFSCYGFGWSDDPRDPGPRKLAKESLEYAPVTLSGQQILAVGQGFAEAVKRCGFVIHACAIMPDHVHLIVKRHDYAIERVVAQLKGAASRRIRLLKLHPFEKHIGRDRTVPSFWAEGLREVALNNAKDIRERVASVERNPAERELPPQRWTFVAPYKK